MSPWVIVRILGNYHSRMHIYIYIYTYRITRNFVIGNLCVNKSCLSTPNGHAQRKLCMFLRSKSVNMCQHTVDLQKGHIDWVINLTDMFWLSTINLIRHCVSRFPRLPLLLSFKNNHRPDWEVGPWNQRVPEGSREWGRRTHLLSKKPTKIQAL